MLCFTQTFYIILCLINVGGKYLASKSYVVVIRLYFVLHEHSTLFFVISGLLILIEFAVYAGEAPSSTTFSYSFALTIVACLLGVAAGICFLLAKKA